MSAFRRLSIVVLLGACALAVNEKASAEPEDAQGFIQHEHTHLEQLLRQAVSSARDAELQRALSTFVDYEGLTKRAFGEPCPSSEPSCEDLWAGYSEAQKTELHSLLEKLVRKTYERNLTKTLDYEITYQGAKPNGDATRVVTEARNRQKPHDPPLRIEYVVVQTPQHYKVVDIVTEGSSLTKNYYDQFRKKMHNPGEGYSNIVEKLQQKIAQP